MKRAQFFGLVWPTMKAPLLCAALLAGSAFAAGGAPLKVGVTLHPYYAWVKNIAAEMPIEVRAVLPGEVDASSYQPSPEDIRKLGDLDALVINGVGHDDFIMDMVKASGNTHVLVIRPNDETPMIRSSRDGTINSHTFISFTNAIQQTYGIARALGGLRPDLAQRLRENAAAYAKRLRDIKNRAAVELAHAKITRVVTVHDGYSYLLQEFGLEVAGVVEPAHGLVPSAAELQQMIALIQREHLRVVLSEEGFPAPLLKVLKEATGAKVYLISHIATGPYAADEFERAMQKNVDTLVQALVKDPA
jgi:zinc transport system substrate-binding protein